MKHHLGLWGVSVGQVCALQVQGLSWLALSGSMHLTTAIRGMTGGSLGKIFLRKLGGE